jgi:hypothetical protein
MQYFEYSMLFYGLNIFQYLGIACAAFITGSCLLLVSAIFFNPLFCGTSEERNAITPRITILAHGPPSAPQPPPPSTATGVPPAGNNV